MTTRFHIAFNKTFTWCDRKLGWRIYLARPGQPATCQKCIKNKAELAVLVRKALKR